MQDFIDKLERVADTIGRQVRFSRDYFDVGVHAPVWQPLGSTFRKAAAMLPLKDISVEFPDLDQVEIYADPLLERALYNLLDNSLRHGMRVSAVTCRYRKEPGALVIVLEDNGAGVPAVIKGKIFNRGYGKNTGYGLFLVHEILAITKMTIAETGIPGEGARFEIRVPEGHFRFVSPAEE
jgi:signal transduction histidine kinase